jgi:hypothetical protein
VTAESRSSRGTRSLTNDCQLGTFSPLNTPLNATRARIAAGERMPAPHAAHRPVAASACNPWVTSSTRRRSKRSAIDPASGPSSIDGTNYAKVARPTHRALVVSS